MTVRNDVSIDWYLSPRIIRISEPSTEIIVQDLHDTSREREQRQENLVYDKLISTAGKEELGGGVVVGLTSTLNNAVIAFDARKISIASGVVTTTDNSGVILTDTNADFITSGVEVGASIVNLTDGSICSVTNVIDGYNLLTDTLGDGGDNTFTAGDNYKIWNVIQCSVSGGNVVAVDDAALEISPILPTAGTQVKITASSSATLQELADLQYSSFNGGVTIDISSSYNKTEYPIGTPRQPVNNLTAAKQIAASRGFTTFFIIGDIVIDTGGDYSNFIFIGSSKTKTLITISSAANVTNCEFSDATVEGTLDGGAQIKNCLIGDLDYVDGFIEDCVLGLGTISLSGVETAHFLNCWSGIPGTATPLIDMGSSGSLAMRNYNGGIELINKSGSEAVSIDLASGHVILSSSVTNGDIVIRGVGHLTDNSVGANVLAVNLTNPNTVADAVRPFVMPLWSKL